MARLRLRTCSVENAHRRDGRLDVFRVEVVGDSKFDAIVDAQSSSVVLRDGKAPAQIALLGVLWRETNGARSQISDRSCRTGEVVVTGGCSDESYNEDNTQTTTHAPILVVRDK